VSDETVATGVNVYEQRGRAFTELIEHLPTEGFGRGGIGVMVHLDYTHLLDLGRSQRLHTASQTRALSVTYETCAAEGCGRPFAWCDIHHTHPWSAGGPTDLANALPLCGWHHRRAHDPTSNMKHLPTREVRFTRRR
jgi:HNH endonuclease